MKRKKTQKMIRKDGYTLEEMRIMTRKLIDESVERLRKELRADRSKRNRGKRVLNARHGVTV